MLHGGCSVTVCSVAPGDPGETRNSPERGQEGRWCFLPFPGLRARQGDTWLLSGVFAVPPSPGCVSPDPSQPPLSTLQGFEALGYSNGHPGG